MRTRTISRAGIVLLAAWAALAPAAARAQEASGPVPLPEAFDPAKIVARGQDAAGYAPPSPQLPLPLYSTNPERGGLFWAGSYVMYRQTNPITDQTVATRGFFAVDTSVLGDFTAGVFIGSGRQALNVEQVSGPNGYSPGFKVELGWRFADGSAVTFGWMHLLDNLKSAFAGPLPPNFSTGVQQEESFLTALVVNVPVAFSGPPGKVQGLNGNVANGQAAFGIWNAATEMQIQFLQRYQHYDVTYRFPVWDTETYRLSGLVGPRFANIWERFFWRTVDFSPVDPVPTPSDVGIYTNIVSNDMYGVHVGCQEEWYLGHGFAFSMDLQGALFLDIVKERARYELGIKFGGSVDKRSLVQYTLAPQVESTFGLMWYPAEGIQCQIGYDFMAFFNTIASPQPISFDMSGLNPRYESTTRFFDGFTATIALVF